MKNKLVGASPALSEIEQEIDCAARSDAKVLVTGESGVGKDIVARLIHQRSRRTGSFVTINCAGVPDSLMESELFGHVRGSFTGAYRDKRGWLDQAQDGTIFMDEVGEMSLRMQALLLRFLENGEIQRVGSDRVQTAGNVRVVVATNRNLVERVADKTFREDLYYRLNVVAISIPPLRERREEIPVLVDHFIRKFNAQYGRTVDVPPETLRAFVEYQWPGNIRELENAVKRIVVLGSARPVHIEIVNNLNGARTAGPASVVALEARPNADAPISLKDIARQAARDAERVAIKEVLDRVHWNRAKAARLLQISYKALLYKIVQCGLVVHDTDKKDDKITEFMAS